MIAAVSMFFAFLLSIAVHAITICIVVLGWYVFGEYPDLVAYEIGVGFVVFCLCMKGMVSTTSPSIGYFVRVVGMMFLPLVVGMCLAAWLSQPYSVAVGIFCSLFLFVYHMRVMHHRGWIRPR